MDQHLNQDQIDELLQRAEKHRAEETVSLESLQAAQRHMEDCASCQTRMRAHEQAAANLALLKPVNQGAKGSLCPPDDAWLEIAAGIARRDSQDCLDHAAECDHCGPLLRQVMDDSVNELTPAEEAALATLDSATRNWQRQTARSLQKSFVLAPAAKSVPALPGKRFSWKLPAIGILALACALIAVWIGVRIPRTPTVDQLLATAYTERRFMEVRIPLAEYAPLATSRGSDESSFDRPPSLMKAESEIAERLQKNPGDPAWLDARARAEMLGKDYDAAIKTLKRALLAQPDAVRLLTDLGTAYYMRGQSLDYGNAIEAFGKALAKNPNDPIALFNRAYACQKLFLYEQAAKDWEQYLRLDPQGRWSQEAREQLNEIKQRNEKLHHHAESLLGPNDLPTFDEPISAKDLSLIAANSEKYQRAALTVWLPQTLNGPAGAAKFERNARSSLAILAGVLERDHNDTWLKQFLQAAPNATNRSAVRDLIDSDRAISAGHYGHALELAQHSVKQFERTGNGAGELRADLALMVAQTRALRYSDCLRTASGLLRRLAKTRYRWLEGATLTDQGECFSGAAKLQEALGSNRKGRAVAENARYPELALRATALGASYLLNTGKMEEGLEALRSGLATFWRSDVSQKLGEVLYACLFDASDGLDWPSIDAFALGETQQQFPTADPVDQALGREFLADAQERAGDYQAARQSLNGALEQLAALPDDPGVAVRKAEIAVAQASDELRMRDGRAAIASLSPFLKAVETTGEGQFQADYFRTFGEAYLLLGRPAEAQPLLERALVVGNIGLRSLESEAAKFAWIRARSDLYHDLVEAALLQGTPAKAFALWQTYKGASLRASEGMKSAALVRNEPPLLATKNLPLTSYPHDTAVMSYVLIKDSIVIFIVNTQGVRVHTLQRPRELEQNVKSLLSLCTDPSSDQAILRVDSLKLYGLLVAPFESEIADTKALRIETDGVLDQVPFDLLRRKNGDYLEDRYEIKFSQGRTAGGQVNPVAPSPIVTPASAAVIIVASGSAGSSLPALPEARLEGNEVASLFHKAAVVSGEEISGKQAIEKLRDVQLLHFAGHAIATYNRVGLVLGPGSLLNSQDIAGLHLQHLKLVVLSACDTANGEEGTATDLNSIARSLVAAGVSDVVASRWRADSTMTRQLMRLFYFHLMAGNSPAKSLSLASAAIRAMPAYHHPYYWASFAVFGTN